MSDKDTFTGQDIYGGTLVAIHHTSGAVFVSRPDDETDTPTTLSMNPDTARAFAAWLLANGAEGATP